jgi:hypothetical protein
MAKERGLLSYLDDWNMPDQSADSRRNASGADSEGDSADYNIPARAPMPEHPEWGLDGPKGRNDFGHSADVEDVGEKGSTWGMKEAEIAKGYSGPTAKYDDGQHHQDIPDKNIHDRGAGSDSYAREHSATTGRGFDGRGHDKHGRGQMDSSRVKPGGLAD